MSPRYNVVKGQLSRPAESAILAARAMLPAMAGKRKYRKTFIREWRKERGLTLERLASRVDMTTSNLSKIERGEQAYTQPTLEALADALNTSAASLIMRAPGATDEIRAVWDSLPPEVQVQALAILKALKDPKAA